MKKRIEIFICQIAIVGLFLIPIYSCKKDQTILKKDPVITWANPADISFGTFLSVTQLNATTDATGTFVYTPASGTKLNEGANQDLKVDFTPDDASFYNSASKTVKINVTALAATGIIFNQQGPKIVGTGGGAESAQGSSVAISSDGNTAVVGGIYDNSQQGAIWICTRSAGVWSQQDGSKMVAGTYFYKLETDGFVKTKKMILVK